MRFSKIHIDGYGRLIDQEFEFTPGLQLIAGPNEQGKSTLRHFIGDMLYGQMMSTAKRMYEESNGLRQPWSGADVYGGQLMYTLDSGDEFEIRRSFDQNAAFLAVYNRSLDKPVTDEFPQAKNGESMFADTHLNMSKSVFLGTATISHISLSDLGDDEALGRMRERLLALTDSGHESGSAEQAITWLNARMDSIGQKTSRTKPLPMMRNRLMDLQHEYQQVHDARQEIRVIEKQHQAVVEEIGALLNQRSTLESELQGSRIHEHAAALKRAQELSAQLDDLTRESMGYTPYREFPVELRNDVTQLGIQLDSSREQAERTRAKLADTEKTLDETIERLSGDGVEVMKEADPEMEARLNEMEAEIQGLLYRIDETKELNSRCQSGYMASQAELSAMPNFSNFAPDPMERISQTTATFEAACRVRDEEEAQRDHVAELLDERNNQLADAEELFDGDVDFGEQLREYETKSAEYEDKLNDLYHDTEELKHTIEDNEIRIPGLYLATLISGIVLTVFIVVISMTQNQSLFLPAVPVVLLLIFFGTQSLLARRNIDKEIYRLTSFESDIERYELAVKKGSDVFDPIREATSCESLREIEAYYDQFIENRNERDRIQEHLDIQIERFEEAKAHTDELFEDLAAMFEEIGMTLESEDQAGSLTMTAIGKYHEYRDTKRRGIENRDALNRYIEELEELEKRLEEVRFAERDLALEVREFLRDNHYTEEENHDSALKALRAYRIRSAQARHRQGDLEVVQGQVRLLKEQLADEDDRVTALENELSEYLVQAGAASVEEFHERLEQADRHRELKQQRDHIEEQLALTLGDNTLATLVEKVGDATLDTDIDPRTPDAIQSDLDSNSELLEAKRKRAHSLQLMMTERSAGLRSLNEVDEERDATVRRVAELELELQAAKHAVEVLEGVTQERYAEVAPLLAEKASEYLSVITSGTYNELTIDPKMRIHVRIPQTQSLSADPERSLSKGTVDQIYLSLRLAMIQTMSADAETVPMVLDDPFAHYDDARLESAMNLMLEVGKTNQVLLFTCREDVIRTAESLEIPVIHL